MKAELAHAIIAAVQEQGLTVDVDDRDSDERAIAYATKLVDMARHSHDKGNRGPAVMAVINLADSEGPDEEPQAPAPQSTEAADNPQEEPQPAADAENGSGDGSADQLADDLKNAPRGFDPYAEREVALAHQKKLGLPEPALPEGIQIDAIPIPQDITRLDDTTFRRLSWERHVLHVYAQRQASLEDFSVRATQRIADHCARQHLQRLSDANAQAKAGKGVTELKAEAEEQEDVLYWRTKNREHDAVKQNLSSLSEGFRLDVERLSREWTERSGVRTYTGGPQSGQ